MYNIKITILFIPVEMLTIMTLPQDLSLGITVRIPDHRAPEALCNPDSSHDIP